MTPAGPPTETRPRVEGDRKTEILDACVAELMEVGYDRLTMDAVARRARASKATLYRIWQSKASLVVDALLRSKHVAEHLTPDTGSLRSDLLTLFTGSGAPGAGRALAMVLTAVHNDEEFATEFRTRFLEPRLAVARRIYRQAAQRGELRPGADPGLLGPALAGILLHRSFLLGEEVTPDLVERVLDQIILPAATGRFPDQETS